MKEKFKKVLTSNFIIWMYLAVALIIELTGVCITSGKFFIRMPYMFLSLLAIGSFILVSIRNQIGRYWCAFILMFVQFAFDLIFILIFKMTGSTFDFSMLKLRNDAMAAIESVPIDFVFVLVSGVSMSLYMLFGHYLLKLVPAPERLLPKAVIAAFMALVVGFHGTMAYVNNKGYNASDLTYKLYSGSYGAYYDNGIFGNFVNELYKGAFFSKVVLGDENELESELYSSVSKETDMFGVAEGYNVVTILAESFEWFSFMNNLRDADIEDAYPGGFDITDEEMEELHPELYAKVQSGEMSKSEAVETVLRSVYKNLYKLYDTSVSCVNNHAREKTDISENHAVLGNYPTDFFINYDYPTNTLPFSMPNILRSLDNVQSNSFHDGKYTFYNRDEHLVNALGFDNFYASEQMEEIASERDDLDIKFVHNPSGVGENNLDSVMIDTCKELMFPSDHRFYTFITTISMHGQYTYREVLEAQGHYDVLRNNGLAAAIKEEEAHEEFFTYAAAALELDKAIGMIFDYLENTLDAEGNRLIDKTVIALYGDHNAYYYLLTNKIKDLYLEKKNGRNYADLFTVPLMFHIGDGLYAQKITKFTTTTDIVPTLLDLLGIRYFDRITYGHSVFDSTESIIYSRAYNEFVADKIYFSSLNNIRFICDDVKDDEAYLTDIENRALEILRKTGMMNKVYYYDFLSGARADDYYARLHEINQAD